eukprot:4046961-Pyramimonas_sp.AAC.1
MLSTPTRARSSTRFPAVTRLTVHRRRQSSSNNLLREALRVTSLLATLRLPPLRYWGSSTTKKPTP